MLAITKGIVWLGLGGAILWQVAIHSGTQDGVAYVHVSAPNVEIMVDEVEYRVEILWETPIVCELRPGCHTLRMTRNGRLVDEQEFTLGIGAETVLMAWEQPTASSGVAPEPNLALNNPQLPTRPGRKHR